MNRRIYIKCDKEEAYNRICKKNEDYKEKSSCKLEKKGKMKRREKRGRKGAGNGVRKGINEMKGRWGCRKKGFELVCTWVCGKTGGKVGE